MYFFSSLQMPAPMVAIWSFKTSKDHFIIKKIWSIFDGKVICPVTEFH